MKSFVLFFTAVTVIILLAACSRDRHYFPAEAAYVNQYFTFGKRHRFNYRIQTCTFEFEGHGRYRQNKDSLMLAFEDYKVTPSRYKIRSQRPFDSLTIVRLRIWAGNGPGDFVRSYQAKLSTPNKVMYDTCKNTVGGSILAVRSRDSVTLDISHINFQPFTLRLAPLREYNIDIELERSPVWYYRVAGFMEDTLILNILDCEACRDQYFLDKSAKGL